MDGEDGKSKEGNNATEANIITASSGVLNVVVSQFMIGIISCIIINNQSGQGETGNHASAIRINSTAY